MEIINTKEYITLINDAYNANYDSMKAAIEYLGKIIDKRKVAILGDMLELGEYEDELHKKIGEEMERLNYLFQKERISWNYYEECYSKLEIELENLESVSPESTRDFSHIKNILSTDFRTDYDKLTPEYKKIFWRKIIKEIIITSDGTLKNVVFL